MQSSPEAAPAIDVAPDWSTFAAFTRYLGVKLEPGQREATDTLFDFKAPTNPGPIPWLGEADTYEPDAPRTRGLFPWAGKPPKSARGVVVIMAGGRGGKSYVFGALHLLWKSFTVDVSMVAPGEYPVAPIVSKDLRLSQQVLNYCIGALKSHPVLQHAVVRATTTELDVLRPDGKIVRIWALPASAGGASVRGRSIVSAYMDESAFFYDVTYAVSDEEIYRAMAPRVLAGGQLVLGSTPNDENGLLWDLFKENAEQPKTALALWAPTRYMRDNEHTRTYVARERARDPDNARREFDAIPRKVGGTVFFDRAIIDAAVDESEFVTQPGDVIVAGTDLGFVGNSSALVIAAVRAHVVEVDGGELERVLRTHVIDIIEERTVDGPLKPSAVCERFAQICSARGARFVMADGHYRSTLIEYLVKYGLVCTNAPQDASEPYVRTKVLFRDGRIRTPRHDRMFRQLREVRGVPQPGGRIAVRHQRWKTGEHGDIAAAFVLAMYQAAGTIIKEPPPRHGTKAWADAERAKRRKEARGEAQRDYWKRR